jgi:prepilin-type N-terminal cleavage/methylation domain-containing protein
VAKMRKIIRRASIDDRGMSLIEMMVAIFIFAILSITVMSVLFTLLDTANATTHRFQNVSEAQPVMDVLTRDIRAANTVIAASPNSMEFDADLGEPGGATDVTFTLAANGSLTETLQQPSTSGTTTVSTRSLATHIVTPATGLFTYYNIDGTLLNTTQSGTPASVADVSINLEDNNDSQLAQSGATLDAQIWLRNVEYAHE